MTDAVVVGSGAAGVHAAWALVEGGRSVVMVDYGARDTVYEPLIPARTWSEIRREDRSQHRYFLGDRFEGIPLGSSRLGAQMGPPRAYVTAGAHAVMPVDTSTFHPLESLAAGGLAQAWGAAVPFFTSPDLEGLPVDEHALQPHYDAVAARIGVSGDRDDGLAGVLGDSPAIMPALDPDTGSLLVLERYRRRREWFAGRALLLGRARLAACSRPLPGRGAQAYRDMDFWADTDRSVYRPRWTLEALLEKPGFRYVPGHLAISFREHAGAVELLARDATAGTERRFEARALVLGAGTFGTARLVLRSLGMYDRTRPVVCNPTTYCPMLNLNMLGRTPADRRHSLTQLLGAFTPSRPGAGPLQLQFYSYRSLLTFKLLKESPLSFRDGLRVLRALSPLMSILGIHHADAPSPTKWCALRRDPSGGPDRLEIRFEATPEEHRQRQRDEREVLALFRRLGCFALKRIDPGIGFSVHYAGPFPMADRSDDPLSTDRDGRLRACPAVHIVDGSVFPRLPAKGLTFTMMANADRIGTLLARRLG